jgi:hypothetical protein
MTTETLLTLLDEAYDKRSWHGPNLRASLRGVTPADAARRLRPGAHNIWELALHAAYWKYVVLRKVTGGRRGSFPLKGSNFFPRPEGAPAEADWKRDLRLLDAMHTDLRTAVARLNPATASPKLLHMIRGAAAHDLYHAGQIRLIRRILPSARPLSERVRHPRA